MVIDLDSKAWWGYIDEDLRGLLKESILLVNIFEEKQNDPSTAKHPFHDYSFIVFPAAKAYEGFLKRVFLDLGFITQQQYSGRRFRVGKALNPALDKRYRKKEGTYDKLVAYCSGKELPDKLWNTWRKSRNLLFHWFPEKRNAVTFEQAIVRLKMILEAMDEAFTTCRLDKL